MGDFFEIVIYLLLFGVVTYLNVINEKKKRSSSTMGVPEDFPTETPVPEIFEEIRRKPKAQKAQTSTSNTLKEEGRPLLSELKGKVPRSTKTNTMQTIETQGQKKKINLRKAILYSEIINRKY